MKMKLTRFNVIICAVTLVVVLTALKGNKADLQSQGCDEGWTDYKDYCYIIFVEETMAGTARNRCQNLEASLSSVWSVEEKKFITVLWEFPNDQIGFVWLGLRGSDSNEWIYDDESSVTTNQGETHWSLLDYIPGMPANISRKCVALRNSGIVAFLDCNMTANAFICKKALTKIFITSSLLNKTSPSVVSPMRHVQLFERQFPTALTSLPGQNAFMAEVVVQTEVGCAFWCFRLYSNFTPQYEWLSSFSGEMPIIPELSISSLRAVYGPVELIIMFFYLRTITLFHVQWSV